MKPILVSHHLCPYVQRAIITLKEKGIDYERIDIDLANKPDWFRAISPLGKTPLLRVGDDAIFESAVICEYLDETHGPRLHPDDPLRRAKHRAWMEFASATLGSIASLYGARDEHSYEAAVESLSARFDTLENVLGEGPYFDGARFCLVDAAFGPVFRYFDVLEPAMGRDLFGERPRLRAWRASLARRPSVQDAVGMGYEEALRDFVVARGGVLGHRLRLAGATVA